MFTFWQSITLLPFLSSAGTLCGAQFFFFAVGIAARIQLIRTGIIILDERVNKKQNTIKYFRRSFCDRRTIIIVSAHANPFLARFFVARFIDRTAWRLTEKPVLQTIIQIITIIIILIIIGRYSFISRSASAAFTRAAEPLRPRTTNCRVRGGRSSSSANVAAGDARKLAIS